MSDAIIQADSLVPEDERGAYDGIHEFLAFRLAEESYALPLSSIREIVKPPPLTEVPRAPFEILGIISVRGRVITVVDMRRRLRVEEKTFDKATRVLLVDAGDEILGLLVDQVLQVFRLQPDEMELAAVVGGDTAEYVMGIGRPTAVRGLGRAREEDRLLTNRNDMLILLDPKALFKR